MIRCFSLLCKLNFNHYSIENLFYKSMKMIKPQDHHCPNCFTKYPDWKKHATYSRYLIGFRANSVFCHTIIVSRFRCSSCGSTHAFLPEFIIPFKSHNLFFVLAVIKDLFVGNLTVTNICAKYEISVSTLYTWKSLFLKHKEAFLGALENLLISVRKFLDFLRQEGLKYHLPKFFAITNRSFLQSGADPPKTTD